MAPPRFLAPIANLPDNAWVQNNLEKLGTLANLATYQDATLLCVSIYAYMYFYTCVQYLNTRIYMSMYRVQNGLWVYLLIISGLFVSLTWGLRTRHADINIGFNSLSYSLLIKPSWLENSAWYDFRVRGVQGEDLSLPCLILTNRGYQSWSFRKMMQKAKSTGSPSFSPSKLKNWLIWGI